MSDDDAIKEAAQVTTDAMGKGVARAGDTVIVMFPPLIQCADGSVVRIAVPPIASLYQWPGWSAGFGGLRRWAWRCTGRRLWVRYWRFIYDESTRFFGPPRYPDGKVWPRP